MSEEENGATVIFVAPSTETELILASIWSQLSGTIHISANNTFVEIGGESLLAMQCLNKIRSACGVDVSPTVLFADDLTLADIAALIDEEKGNST